MKHKLFLCALIAGLQVMYLSGCVTPRVEPSNLVDPDESPMGGAITSQDIRTVASQMAPEILSIPEIADTPDTVRIILADFKNNSRFLIDKNIFASRLRLELNRYGNNKIRFISKSRNVQRERVNAVAQRQEERVREYLKKLGTEIANLDWVKNSPYPVRIAVIPVINTNLVNMNADSFTAMLRSVIVSAAKGKVQFLMPGKINGADFYLTGQFVPESIKTESIVDMGVYIKVMEDRAKRGQSFDLTDNRVPQTSNNNLIMEASIRRESELVRMLRDPALRANPNVNKRLNVMLVQPGNDVAVFEKMFLIDRKFTDNSGKADFILNGEIRALSQRRHGVASDYLLISVQLIDIESNEMVWENAYETKRLTESGIVYQ